MKTTLDINDELLVKAKAASARERKSLTTLIEEGRRPLPIFKGKGGVAKGIDPTSNRSMLDAASDDS